MIIIISSMIIDELMSAKITDKNIVDELLKHFKGQITLNGTTIVSVELDFEIPRGFVVKIMHVRLEVANLEEDIESQAVDKLLRAAIALILDPDDITSTVIPVDNVQHDVLLQHQVTALIIAGTAEAPYSISTTFVERDYSQQDVITARNMRLNGLGSGTDGTDLTESSALVFIDYLLVPITNAILLSILDIL